MAEIEMRFALYPSLLKARADREGVLYSEVRSSCGFHDAEVKSITGDEERFKAVISHKNPAVLEEIVESARRHLAGSGVLLNEDIM